MNRFVRYTLIWVTRLISCIQLIDFIKMLWFVTIYAINTPHARDTLAEAAVRTVREYHPPELQSEKWNHLAFGR